uniref:Uncharacterized protein n=1 Tax=Bracon brevicornis TaxID=1563983 RepID=A0A6V7LWS2_9HYME
MVEENIANAEQIIKNNQVVELQTSQSSRESIVELIYEQLKPVIEKLDKVCIGIGEGREEIESRVESITQKIDENSNGGSSYAAATAVSVSSRSQTSAETVTVQGPDGEEMDTGIGRIFNSRFRSEVADIKHRKKLKRPSDV